MSISCARTAIGVLILGLFLATPVAAQTMEKVDFFVDSISEKGDLNHLVRLSGGSSWVLAEATLVAVPVDVLVVMRDVVVEGKRVAAAWVYVGGVEIPAKHLEGVYPKNAAFLTRVMASEDQGTKLRLADGSELLVPGYNKFISNRWTPPYKVLLSANRLSMHNLIDGRRVEVRPAK